MAWVKFDDGYPLNRKVWKLTDAAFRLDVSAACYSAAQGLDGRIPADDIDIISSVRKPDEAAAELVKRGRWHTPGHDCKSDNCYPIADGWLIHDFLDYNPSRATVEKRRDDRARAGRKGGSKTSSKHLAPVPAAREAEA